MGKQDGKKMKVKMQNIFGLNVVALLLTFSSVDRKYGASLMKCLCKLNSDINIHKFPRLVAFRY